MDCVNCGAPLPSKSNVCRYCETLNDTDLRALKSSRSKGAASERPCPRCKVPLEAMRLKLEIPLEIDRCTKCFGIFFDPGELDEVLDTSVKRAYEVDLERLDTLVREETSSKDYKEVTYVPCPDCGEFMHRKSYGAKAGVVVDRCRLHGVWLDGGELNGQANLYYCRRDAAGTYSAPELLAPGARSGPAARARPETSRRKTGK